MGRRRRGGGEVVGELQSTGTEVDRRDEDVVGKESSAIAGSWLGGKSLPVLLSRYGQTTSHNLHISVMNEFEREREREHEANRSSA